MNTSTATTDAVRYPFFSLPNAEQVAEAIRDCGGANVDVPRGSVAHALNTSEKSGGFQQRISTAKTFGFIEGRGSYRLTSLAKQYFFPTEEGQKEKAFSSFFGAPAVYAELIKKFDGQKLPAVNLLANIVQREHGVPESWKDRVAASFLKTAQATGAMDSNGFLRYRASRHAMHPNPNLLSTKNAITGGSTDVSGDDKADTVPTVQPVKSAAPGRFSMRIPFGETFAILETPQRDKLDPELWEMLNLAVQMLKPKAPKPKT